MRILIVTPWFPTTTTPESGLFVAREAKALAAAHRVHVLHFDASGARSQPLTPPGVTVAKHAMRLSRLSAHAQARALVRKIAAGFDIVHTHALPGIIPWRFHRPADLPWIHTEHWSGITAPETLSGFERVVRRLLLPTLRRPDVVVTECERLARGVRAVRRGRTEIVPCIVDEVTPPPALPPANGTVRIVSIGGLVPRKGPDLAVDTVGELVRRGVDARLTWVGDGPLRTAVTHRITQEGLADRIRLTGALPPQGVSAELAAAHVFLLPTQGDNFCVVSAEALVHGRPIVSGAETGAVDYAEPAVSAFVSTQTGPAYATALMDVLARTRHLSSAAIAATVAGRFSSDMVRRRLESVYRSVR